MKDLGNLAVTYKVILTDGQFISFSELRYAKAAKEKHDGSKLWYVIDGVDDHEIKY